tara:strand:- start:442 stop:564 length:123 start_codon:yes stop_codon:yes gene_type:complete
MQPLLMFLQNGGDPFNLLLPNKKMISKHTLFLVLNNIKNN